MTHSERRALHRQAMARICTGPARAAPAIWPYPNHRSLEENDGPYLKHEQALWAKALERADKLWNG